VFDGMEDADASIEQIRTIIQELTAQKQREIKRLDQEIKALDTELETLLKQKENMKEQTSIEVNLDPDVTRKLSQLCIKINACIADSTLTYPYVVSSSLDYVAISYALQKSRKTIDMIQNNLSAIAHFMCRSIHFNHNTEICSSELTAYGHFDIHLGLQGGAKDLRIFSGVSGSDHDQNFNIMINLTNN
jgi:hypothetical protein